MSENANGEWLGQHPLLRLNNRWNRECTDHLLIYDTDLC